MKAELVKLTSIQSSTDSTKSKSNETIQSTKIKQTDETLIKPKDNSTQPTDSKPSKIQILSEQPINSTDNQSKDQPITNKTATVSFIEPVTTHTNSTPSTEAQSVIRKLQTSLLREPPKNALEFEKNWSSLRKQPEQLYSYFKVCFVFIWFSINYSTEKNSD